jgi:hypothetical protein
MGEYIVINKLFKVQLGVFKEKSNSGGKKEVKTWEKLKNGVNL